MVTNKNEAKTVAKHISCDCKYKFDGTTCNSNQKWNNKSCSYKSKNYHACQRIVKKMIVGTCVYENDKYLKSIADTSMITCDEVFLLWILYQQKWQIL